MRYIFLAVALLCFSLPVLAEEASPRVSDEMRMVMRGIIYNMCRGGGFAYELEAEYADKRDENCVTETYAKLSEIQQRADDLRITEELRKNSNNTKEPEAYIIAAQRTFYIDYCIEKNQQRYPSLNEGEYGYVDNRALTGKWQEITQLIKPHTHLDGSRENNDIRKGAVTIFHENISLPAKLEDMRQELTQNGFVCEKDD